MYYFPLNAAGKIFKHPPIVAYRRTSNLRDILVKAKLPIITPTHNTNLPPGSFRCGQVCAACPYITNGLTHRTFFSTGATRQIKSHLTCNTKTLIDMIQCNRCHLQYIGEITRRLRQIQRTNALSTTLNPNPPLLPNISSLILIIAILTCNYSHSELIHSSRDSIRKARESLLIK